MTLPIDRTTKAALDANLVNGVTSDAPVIKASNDVVYNTIDELYNYALALIASGALSPYPPANYNKLINGNVDVWQRGTLFDPALGVYTADRWKTANSIDNNVKVIQSNSVPNKKSRYSLRAEQTVSIGGVGALSDFLQIIEDYQFFQGQTVTFSGYVKCDAGVSVTPRIEDNLASIFGTAITSTSWTYFSVTKTVDNAANYLFPAMRLNRNNLAIGLGANFAQLMLNIGDIALPFQPKSYDNELRSCLRYYEPLDFNALLTIVRSGTLSIFAKYPFKVKKRVSPTLANAPDLSTTLGSGSKQISILRISDNATIAATGNVTVKADDATYMTPNIGSVQFLAVTSFSGVAGDILYIAQGTKDTQIGFDAEI